MKSTEDTRKTASSNDQPVAGGHYRAMMSDEVFQRYQKLIHDTCSIFLKPVKKPLLVNRLMKRLRELGISSYEEYLDQVTQGPNQARELQYLIDAITTNKTEFFREGKQWEYLASVVWPQLQAEKKKQQDFTIRIWSSACSTGEEPYSLAIHALDHLDAKDPWKIQILASDINEQVLRQAQTGIYDAHRVDTIPADYLKKYFGKIGDKYRVRPEAQNLVTFRKINLKGAFPKLTRPLDMIFCRNVIIYFDKQTQAELMSRFFQCLGPGGYLFLGHSESLNGICSLYRFVSASIYRKEG